MFWKLLFVFATFLNDWLNWGRECFVKNQIMKHLIMLYFTTGIFEVSYAIASYEGYKVYRGTPENQYQVNFIRALHQSESYDFWTNGALVGYPVDIMVPKDKEDAFLDLCKKYGIENHIYIRDVQRLIESEKNIVAQGTTENGGMKWDKYYKLEDIYSWMDQLALQYPTIVTVIVPGETHEGRPIKVLKLSFKEGKKAVFIEGGLHAREWISPATTNYLISQLLTSSDTFVRLVAESYDWFIVPVANPDGYVYSHTTDRMWRKNRSPQFNPTGTDLCYGTDGNRNWDVFWGQEDTSTHPCDETYGGPRVASEAETIHLSKIISSIGSRLDVFLSFHSYGNLLLLPYGHTREYLDNYHRVLKVGQAAIEALSSLHGTKYNVGNTAEMLYSHSGGTMDWVKSKFKPPIAFSYELTGDPGGFILPPEYIFKNCEEVLKSFVTIFIAGYKEGLITLS